MQKMGNVDPLTLTVQDQAAYQKIVNDIYQDAMGLVMMAVVGLMVLGIILALTLKDIKSKRAEKMNSSSERIPCSEKHHCLCDYTLRTGIGGK